jgi:hypothetical protein
MDMDIAGFIAALDALSEEYGVYINSKMSHHMHLVDSNGNVVAKHFNLDVDVYECFRI